MRTNDRIDLLTREIDRLNLEVNRLATELYHIKRNQFTPQFLSQPDWVRRDFYDPTRPPYVVTCKVNNDT